MQQDPSEAPIKKGCVKNRPGPVQLKFLQYLPDTRARLRIAGSRRDGLFKKAQTLESMTHAMVVVLVMPQPGDGPVSFYCKDGNLAEAVRHFTEQQEKEQAAAAEEARRPTPPQPVEQTALSPAVPSRRRAQQQTGNTAKRRKSTPVQTSEALELNSDPAAFALPFAEFDLSFNIVDLASRRHHWFSAPIYQQLTE